MATLPCNNGKWSLGHYSRFAGEFTYTGSYNTAVEACAAAKMKAWVYDSAKKVYVPYNPGMKFDRVECAAENNSYLIENTYNVAFRHSPLKLTISSAGKQLAPPVKILAGEVITVLADQPVNWSVTGEGSLISDVQRSTTVLTFRAKAKGTVNITAQGKCETKQISIEVKEKFPKNNIDIRARVARLPNKTLAIIDRRVGREKVISALENPVTVELMIADKRLISRGSQFGHIALAINGIEFGMSPNGWDVREKHTFINSYTSQGRPVISYQLSMTSERKRSLVNAILNSMQEAKVYNLLDNSCSSVMVKVFAAANTNIVDPRWSFNIYAPADINNFLRNTIPNKDIVYYPAK